MAQAAERPLSAESDIYLVEATMQQVEQEQEAAPLQPPAVLTYVAEDRSRRARMVNIASAILELAERFGGDPDKRRIESRVLRRYITSRLDDLGLEYPDLDEIGDLKAHGDAYGGGGLGLRLHQGHVLLTTRTIETAERFLRDPGSFVACDVISADELGLVS